MLVGVVVGVLIGGVLGFVAGWLPARGAGAGATARASTIEASLERTLADRDARTAEAADLHARLAGTEARLEAQTQSVEEQRALLEMARSEFREAFEALAAETLAKSNESFLTLATERFTQFHIEAKGDLEARTVRIEELVAPVRETIEKVGGQIQRTEEARREAHGELSASVRLLQEAHRNLQSETRNLVTALRAPTVRGRWGEIQLKRVVEMAGMLEYCDFTTQTTTQGDDGALRPDMVVNLPGGKSVVVDAKTPLDAYLSAVEAKDDDARQTHIERHAAQVRDHIKKLSAKSYWSQFDGAPEFVVLFLPGETFFSAALEADPSLIQEGVDSNVILATPTTLIALLRSVAYGWQQERLARDSQEIATLGKELSTRISTLLSNFQSVGSKLGSAVDAYNKAVGSMEARVIPQAKRFAEKVSAAKEVDDLTRIQKSPRELSTKWSQIEANGGVPAIEAATEETAEEVTGAPTEEVTGTPTEEAEPT